MAKDANWVTNACQEGGGSLALTIRPVERLVYLNFGRGRLLAIF